MSVALKEANETVYWLDLLGQTRYLDPQQYNVLRAEADALLRILAAIVKNTKTTRP